MTETSIRFHGIISRPLYLRTQALHIGHRRLALLIFPAAFAIMIWGGAPELPLWAKALLTIIACAFVPLMALLQRWQWQRLFKRTPYLSDPISGDVSERGLRVESTTGNSEVPWERFVKYKMQEGLILLYQGPNIFNVVAREFFASAEDWAKAQRIISERAKAGRA
jgi:hypothetical protein